MTYRTMRTRRCLTQACLAAALTVVLAAAAQARDLSIAMPEGGLLAAERATLFRHFTETTGIPLAASASADPAASLPAADDGAPDILLLRGDRLRTACQANQLGKIDWDLLGGKSKFAAPAVSDCGLGAVIVTTVLAWDRDKFPATPTWQDFWDIAKLPGKRGLRQDVRTTLEIALLADGVAQADIYRTLRADDGVDRAFRKLDQLRPYIVWWHDGADAARILGRGEVLLTAAPSGPVAQVAQAEHRNLGLQWNASLVGVLSWAVRRDSTEQDQARQFLKAAADPLQQAALQAILPYGGLAVGANDKLPADIAAYSSGLPAHLAVGLPIDAAFWAENYAKLAQRFAAWQK